jgi:sulfatase maturation enzyme AslB (radical SAM superfamily)
MCAMTERLIFHGPSAAIDDGISGVQGGFEQKAARLSEGEAPVIGVARKNLFLLPDILSFLSESVHIPASVPRFDPRPAATIRSRFTTYLNRAKDVAKGAGIRVEVVDEQLGKLLGLVEKLAGQMPETQLVRLLGIVCDAVLAGPLWFVFETVNACNADCYYCNIHAPSRKPTPEFLSQRLSIEVFKSTCDDLAELGTDGVTILANGEPLLNPDFAEMAVYAKKKKLHTSFFTNGLLLKEEMSRTIIDAAVDQAFVTISAADRETYAALHSNQGMDGFDRVVGNLAELDSLKRKSKKTLPDVIGVHVICSKNKNQTLAMARQAAGLGFKRLRLALIRVDEHNRHLALSEIDILMLRKELPDLERYCAEAGIELWEGYRFQLENADDPAKWSGGEFVERGCFVGWGLGLVKANADLSFCCVVKPIANLEKKRFRDAWLGPFYRDARLAARDLKRHSDFTFSDGSKLYTPACHHCDNHDINALLHRELRETGLADYLE